MRPGDDPDFWLRHVRFGVGVSFGLLALSVPYVWLRAGELQHLLLLIIAVTSVFTLGVRLLPWTRMLQTRRALWFFYAWSTVATLAITLAAAADGGVNSPMLLYYAVPMLFAAIAYPQRSVLVLGGVMLLTVGVMTVATDVTEPGRVWLTLGVLALSSWAFAYAAGNYRRSAQRTEALAERLALQVNVDSLTGCMNHRAFQEVLAGEVARAQRSGTPIALLLGDIDHFKQVNDRHGHRVGDDVLERVGVALREHARAGDHVARVGGEEFAVLLHDADLPAALEAAQRFRRCVGQITDPVPVTMSFGAAVLPGMTDTVESLCETADLGLYAAKRSGRDCVSVHGQGPSTPDDREAVHTRVSTLLSSGGLHSVFQPIVDVRTGAVLAYEALARVRDSQLRPDQWLELAEESGQRSQLEGAMLDAALNSWPYGPDGPRLFVNLSPDALAAGIVWPRLERMGSHTVIEISERDPVSNYEPLRSTLDELRSRGVGLAIDDVGAGHANMRHILELRPDYVKIDRSLVMDVDQHPMQASLLAAITAFANEHGVTIIGEGIERPDEANTLARLGIHLGQGYLLARPSFPPPSPLWPERSGLRHGAAHARRLSH